jgi:hypothetical protein
MHAARDNARKYRCPHAQGPMPGAGSLTAPSAIITPKSAFPLLGPPAGVIFLFNIHRTFGHGPGT